MTSSLHQANPAPTLALRNPTFPEVSSVPTSKEPLAGLICAPSLNTLIPVPKIAVPILVQVFATGVPAFGDSSVHTPLISFAMSQPVVSSLFVSYPDWAPAGRRNSWAMSVDSRLLNRHQASK